ncbi:MAG: hypothetical protein Q9221_006807 [Calogaya cf. arnoldii]
MGDQSLNEYHDFTIDKLQKKDVQQKCTVDGLGREDAQARRVAMQAAAEKAAFITMFSKPGYPTDGDIKRSGLLRGNCVCEFSVKKAVDHAISLANARDAESHLFFSTYEEELAKDRILYDAHTEDALKKFQKIEEYLSSLAYQREDVRESCQLMDIPWHGLEDTDRCQAGKIEAIIQTRKHGDETRLDDNDSQQL